MRPTLVRAVTVAFAVLMLATFVVNFAVVAEIQQGLPVRGSLPLRTEGPPQAIVAALLPEGSDNFLKNLQERLREETARENIVLLFFSYNKNDDSLERTWFPTAMESGFDAVFLVLAGGIEPQPFLETARHRRLPLVFLGTQPPGFEVRGFVGSGPFHQGWTAAKFAATIRPNHLRAAVLLPWDEEGFWDDDPFFVGVRSALSSHPNAKLYGVRRSLSGFFSGEAAAFEALDRYPHLNLLFSMDEADTEGAVQIVVDSNLLGNVDVVGAGDSTVIRGFLDKGLLAASVILDANAIAQAAVAELLSQLEGHPPSPPRKVDFMVHPSKNGTL